MYHRNGSGLWQSQWCQRLKKKLLRTWLLMTLNFCINRLQTLVLNNWKLKLHNWLNYFNHPKLRSALQFYSVAYISYSSHCGYLFVLISPTYLSRSRPKSNQDLFPSSAQDLEEHGDLTASMCFVTFFLFFKQMSKWLWCLMAKSFPQCEEKEM